MWGSSGNTKDYVGNESGLVGPNTLDPDMLMLESMRTCKKLLFN